MTTNTVPKIHAAMANVMQDLVAIGKDNKNKQQGWMFRGIDQAYNALHPLMAKYKIITVPRVLDMVQRVDRPTRSGGMQIFTVLKVEYDFISGEDGSRVTAGPVMGESADSGDKGCNQCLATAHKYVLFQTFLIPTEQTKLDDPDMRVTEIVPPPPPPPPVPDKLTAVPAKQVAAKKNPAKPEAEEPVINNAEGAAEVTDFLINVAVNMHSGSIDSLMDFWMKNKRVIDKLDHEFHDEYERLKVEFTKLRKATEEKTDE